ncbi:hypothetical protein EV356DRAFT_489744 [Viridothelium virens]|uniref:ZZ-type domain-containing protein n=1 Tax=Viridothelium virens TaxID=1048519 RepID=A0A6A6H217_VIRVR|nr:hypothetical protein EV356DRAFT_489744 [Viridothelium virens]
MATVSNAPVTPDTLITVKVLIEGNTRKFKLPLNNLTAQVLPEKLRHLLDIPPNQGIKFERYSDSAGAFIVLEPGDLTVYKTLHRAAKAKLKLRLRVTPLPVERKMDQPNQQNIPGSFVQPPPPPPVPSVAPPPPATGLAAAHWANVPPAIVSSQQSSSLAPTPSPSQNRRTPAGVRFQGVNFNGQDTASRARQARQQFFAELSNISQKRDLALRLKEAAPSVPQVSAGAWSVYCNECDKPMTDEHFHCSICDDGDYDLCPECVSAGKVCPGANHWLIKRTLKDGRVVNSVTEKVAPKLRAQLQTEKEQEKEMPGAFTEEPKTVLVSQAEPAFQLMPKCVPTRTCNSCVKVFEEDNFVHCTSCEDYDLCLACHDSMNHGHHPAHEFKPVDTQLELSTASEARCRAGRNQRHAATCDGCEKRIFGVRHKCLNCPDYDLCSDCVKSAQQKHTGHRFAPLYDPLPAPRLSVVRHYGIYCDGPLCSGSEYQTFITGVRYKCAVCHDFDLCANCEALPGNPHNNTHPLIKFKTPVRNVSVTTMGEDKDGAPLRTMGDQPSRRSTGTATASSTPTKVQTVADLKPTDEKASRADVTELSKKIVTPTPRKQTTGLEIAQPKDAELNAHFVRDTIPDGTNLRAEERFTQVWTLRNPGPHAWPQGCSVRYVGGDNMLNVDHSHPASASEIASATESNLVDRRIEVGEEVAFRVLMKAPKRGGKSISYWRLKAPNGTPFGHRLWCDINVVVTGPATHDIASPAAAPAELGSTTEHIEYAGPSMRAPPTRTPTDMYEEMVRRLAAKRKASQGLMEKAGETQFKINEQFPTLTPSKGKATQTQVITEASSSQQDATEGDSMIFPRLDKESPVPSVHEATLQAAPTVKSEDATASSPKCTTDRDGEVKEKQEVFEDMGEDIESLELASESDDDGFVTDEEYDILDASDDEFMQQGQKGSKN